MANITLKMIAEKAGVSVSTVSLALRGKGTLSRERSQQIRELAQSMGYRPNPVLSSLASKRFSQSAAMQAMPLALLEFPIGTDGKQRLTIYRSYLEAAANDLGYALHPYSPEDFGQYGNFLRTLYNRGVAGILLTGQANAYLDNPVDDWQHFVTVQCGRFLGPARVNCVRPNIFQAVGMAFRQLWSRGYRRIGFGFGCHGLQLDDDDARYGAAYAMLRQQAESERVPLFEGRFDDFSARAAWVREHRPEVVIGFSPHDWYALRDHGFDIPGEIGYAALHLDAYHVALDRIAGLVQQNDVIARESVLLLDQMVRHNRSGIPERPLETLVPSIWHEGRSIRPMPGGTA